MHVPAVYLACDYLYNEVETDGEVPVETVTLACMLAFKGLGLGLHTCFNGVNVQSLTPC